LIKTKVVQDELNDYVPNLANPEPNQCIIYPEVNYGGTPLIVEPPEGS